MNWKKTHRYFTYIVTCQVCFSQVLEVNIIDKTKFATFSNSAFIMNYSLNMDSKLDRSVEGLLVEEYPVVKCLLLRRLSMVVEGRKEGMLQREEHVLLR